MRRVCRIAILGLCWLFLAGARVTAAGLPGPEATGVVLRVYHDMLGREPDAAGLSRYAGELQAGRGEAWLRRSLASSPEYRKRETSRGDWRRSHVWWPALGATLFLAYAWASRWSRVATWVPPAVVLAAGAAYYGLVWRYAQNIPFGDDFDSILAWANKPASVRWARMADFNNEHRIVASRLLVEGIRAASGLVNFKWMTVGMNLAVAGLAVAFWLELRRTPAAIPWIPLAGLLLFSPMSWFNMTQGTPYALVVLLVFLAFLAARHLSSWRWLPVSFLLVTAAALSMMPGIIAFGLLPVAAALRRLDPQRHPGATWRSLLCRGFALEVAVLVTAAVMVGVLYFRGCPTPESPLPRVPFSFLDAIPYTLRFAGALAGGSLSLYVGAAFLALLLWITIQRGWARSPALFLTAVFIFLNGAGAAFARMPLGFSAEDFRYRIYPLVLGVCSIGLLAEFAPAWMRRRPVLAAAGVFLTCVYVLSVSDGLARLRQRASESIGGTAAWVRGTGGPCYPKQGRAYADAILKESIRQGIYRVPDEVRAAARVDGP